MNFALGKGKGKGLSVTHEDVSFMNMDAFWKEMESILQAQKEHFMQHITLRYVKPYIIHLFNFK
jgi:hypothetical protein